jgi:hypothetical protein
MVEMGAVGLGGFAVLLAVPVGLAVSLVRRSPDRATAELGRALLAAFLAVVVGMATFDGLGFPIFTSLFFLLLGLTGALWRLGRRPGTEPCA